MMLLSPTLTDELSAALGPIESINFVHSIWTRLLRGQPALTRAYRVRSTRGTFKLVTVHPQKLDDAVARNNLRECLRCHKHLADTGVLPRIEAASEVFVALEWVEGQTLLQDPVASKADAERLADCLLTAYLRMQAVSPPSRDELRGNAYGLYQRGALTRLVLDKINKLIESIEIPERLLRGPCFGDVSMANFIRRADGHFVYIDTMGVVVEDMPASIEKTFIHLAQPLHVPLLNRIDEIIPGAAAMRRFSLLNTHLRRLGAKSVGGRSAFSIYQRRKKAQQSAAVLEELADGAMTSG
jgi:hypothetical protein